LLDEEISRREFLHLISNIALFAASRSRFCYLLKKERRMRSICFFDMDWTLIAANSGLSFVRYSFRCGKTSPWMMIQTLVDYLRYRFDILDMSKAYRKSLQYLVGVQEEELIHFCQDWFEKVVQKLIFPEARRFVQRHHTRGDFVAIISNSTTYAVAPLAHHLAIPHVLANQLEVHHGRFTGRYVEPLCFRQGKLFWAQRLAQELNTPLEESTFYTDSITDLPLLEAVRYPKVVNPDSRLRTLAGKRGWPILDFGLRGP
jgi:HAD superfamily hydrolase (TIGR01490 family)